MKEKIKALKEKLNPKVAIIGGVIVISTSFGTCHLMEDEPASPETEAAPAAPETPPAPAEEVPEEPKSDA